MMVKRIVLLILTIVLGFNLYAQNPPIKCPWGFSWGIDRSQAQTMLLEKHKKYYFIGNAKGSVVCEITFGGNEWSFASFEFFQAQLYEIIFSKGFSNEKSCLEFMETMKNTLLVKYPDCEKNPTDGSFIWNDANGQIQISMNEGDFEWSGGRYFVNLSYRDKKLAEEFKQSQWDEL